MTKNANRVRNWSNYNEALTQRGSLSFWFSEKMLKNWYSQEKSGSKGRPLEFSDEAIVFCLTMKNLFKLGFRQTEGFVRSIVELMGLELKVPDYTLLCIRQKHVKVPLVKSFPPEGACILVDTTGIKVFGEGEWKVRQHGYVKHRLWRKLHLAVDATSQEIASFCLTDLGVQDFEGLKRLSDEGELEGARMVVGDGAYDRFACYELAEQKGFNLLTPPQKNAKPSSERLRNKKKASAEAVARRDEAIFQVRKLGLDEWKEQMGYHRRSLVETTMFRMKTLLGNRLRTRTMENQITEIAVRCMILNKMSRLGFG